MQDARGGPRSYAAKKSDAQAKASKKRAAPAVSGRSKTLVDAFRQHGAKLCDGSRLNAVGKGVTTIGSVPPTLTASVSALYLSQNNLRGLVGVEQFQSVRLLSVGGNLIDRFEELGRLAGLRHLRNLNLVGNPICDQPNYRLRVIDKLSTIQLLDAADVTKKEREIAPVIATQDQAMRTTLVRNHYDIYKLQRAALVIQLHRDLFGLVLVGVQNGRFDRVPGPHDAAFDIDRYMSVCDVKEVFSVQAQSALEQQMLAIVVRTFRKLSEHPKFKAKEYLVGLVGASAAVPSDLHQLCIAWDEAYNSVTSLQQQTIINLKGVCERNSRDAVSMLKEWLVAQPEKRRKLLSDVTQSNVSMLVDEKSSEQIPGETLTRLHASKSQYFEDALSSSRLPPQQKDPDRARPKSPTMRYLTSLTSSMGNNCPPIQVRDKRESKEKDRGLSKKGNQTLRSGEFGNRTLGEAICSFSLRTDRASQQVAQKPLSKGTASRLAVPKSYCTSIRTPDVCVIEDVPPTSKRRARQIWKKPSSPAPLQACADIESLASTIKSNVVESSPRKLSVRNLIARGIDAPQAQPEPLMIYPVNVSYPMGSRNDEVPFGKLEEDMDAASVGTTSDNTSSSLWIRGDISEVSARKESGLRYRSSTPSKSVSHSMSVRNSGRYSDQNGIEEEKEEVAPILQQPKGIQPNPLSNERLQELEYREEKYIKALMESEQRELELRNSMCNMHKQLAYYQHAFQRDLHERQRIKHEVEKRVMAVAQPKILKRYFIRWVQFYSWTLQFNHVRKKRAFVVQYNMFWQWRRVVWMKQQVLEIVRKRQVRVLWIVFGEWANATRLSVIASRYQKQQYQRMLQGAYFIWKDAINRLRYLRNQEMKLEFARNQTLMRKCWKEWKRMAQYRQKIIALDRLRHRENSSALQKLTLWKWKIFILAVGRPTRNRVKEFCRNQGMRACRRHLNAWKGAHCATKLQRSCIIRRSWKRWVSSYRESIKNRSDDQKKRRMFLKTHFQAWKVTANDILTSRRSLALAKRYVNQRRTRKLWLHWKFFAITRRKYRQGSTKALKHYFVHILRWSWTLWKTRTTKNLQSVKHTKYRTLRFHFESLQRGIQLAKRERFQTRMICHKRCRNRLKRVKSCLMAWRRFVVRHKWAIQCCQILQHHSHTLLLGFAWRVWRTERIKSLLLEGAKLQQSYDKISEDKNELEADLMIADDKILSTQDHNNTLAKQCDEYVARIQSLEKIADNIQHESAQNRSNLVNTITDLEQRCRELESRCAADNANRDCVSIQLQTLENDKMGLTARISELQLQVDSEKRTTQDAHTAADILCNKMKQEILDIQAKLDAETAAHTALQQDLNELRLQLAQEQKERDETANRLQEYEHRIATTCQAINQHENEHEREKMRLRYEHAQLEANCREEYVRNSELQKLLNEKNDQIRILENAQQSSVAKQALNGANDQVLSGNQTVVDQKCELYPIQLQQRTSEVQHGLRTTLPSSDGLMGEITSSSLLRQRGTAGTHVRPNKKNDESQNYHLRDGTDCCIASHSLSHSQAPSKAKATHRSDELAVLKQERLIDERATKVHGDIKILQERISKRLEQGVLAMSNNVEHLRSFSNESAKLLLANSFTSLSEDSSSPVESVDFPTHAEAYLRRTKTNPQSSTGQVMGTRLASTRKLSQPRKGRENVGSLSNKSSAPSRKASSAKKSQLTSASLLGQAHNSSSTLIAAARKKKTLSRK